MENRLKWRLLHNKVPIEAWDTAGRQYVRTASHDSKFENIYSVADPGFGQGGGPRIFFRDFADIAK